VKSGYILHTFTLLAAEYYLSAQYENLKSTNFISGLCKTCTIHRPFMIYSL